MRAQRVVAEPGKQRGTHHEQPSAKGLLHRVLGQGTRQFRAHVPLEDEAQRQPGADELILGR